MIKSFAILFLIFLHHSSAYPGDENHRYEPLMLMKNLRAPALKTFPFLERQSRNDEYELIEKYACPAETDDDVINIEIASMNNYRLKYCLFEKNFQKDEDRICKKEVKPVFLERADKNFQRLECGFQKRQFIYSLSYFTCGEQEVLEKFREVKVRRNPGSIKFTKHHKYTYEICYDTVGKSVVWTKHHVQTPQLFQNPYFQNQPELPENEISTDSYFMNPDLFLILKDLYEQEKVKNTSNGGGFIMVPRPLVPADHHALPMYRKSTHHYINMAPLWENLVPLMTAIDEGIKQAQMKLEAENPDSYNDLIIHTRVTALKELNTTSNTWFNFLLFQGNIWYKFIYQLNAQTAALIIIHNTPGNPPDPSEGCIVGTKKECTFQDWPIDEKISQRIITEGLEKYAYCCRVTAREIRSIFSSDHDISNYLEIDRYLKINSLLTEDEPLPSKL